MKLPVMLLPDYAGPEGVLVPAHADDVGCDLYATADVTLLPGEQILMPCGFAVALPEGFEMQVRTKSGLALKGLTVSNSPATVDPGYRGEIKVILRNENPAVPAHLWLNLLRTQGVMPAEVEKRESRTYIENHTIQIKRGTKIAQAVFARFERAQVERVESLPETARGEGGFGSTFGVTGAVSPVSPVSPWGLERQGPGPRGQERIYPLGGGSRRLSPDGIRENIMRTDPTAIEARARYERQYQAHPDLDVRGLYRGIQVFARDLERFTLRADKLGVVPLQIPLHSEQEQKVVLATLPEILDALTLFFFPGDA